MHDLLDWTSYNCGPLSQLELYATGTTGTLIREYDFPGMPMRNSIVSGGSVKTAWFKDTEGNIRSEAESR